MLRAVAAVFAFASLTATSIAKEPLPEEVKRPYLELCQSTNGATPEYLLAIPYRVADLNGDGSPDYLFEVKHKTYDYDAHPPLCRHVVFSKVEGRYTDVARFSCCKYQVDSAKRQVTCADPGHRGVVLTAAGGWPADGKSATAAEAKAAYDKAASLFKAGKYADAENAVCGTAKRQCVSDAAYLDMCAKAELMTKRLDAAEEDLDDATSIAPDYAPSYVTEGMLWQMRGSLAQAIKSYETYVEKAPTAPDRDRIAGQIEKLKQQRAAKP